MATVEQMQVWLVEAENAYHALQTGTLLVEAQDSNGERCRYTAANASKLWQYILSLREQLAGTNTVAARRPLRPVWS